MSLRSSLLTQTSLNWAEHTPDLISTREMLELTASRVTFNLGTLTTLWGGYNLTAEKYWKEPLVGCQTKLT